MPALRGGARHRADPLAAQGAAQAARARCRTWPRPVARAAASRAAGRCWRRWREQIERQRGVRVPPDAWDLTRLPAAPADDASASRTTRGAVARRAATTSTRCASRSAPRLRAALAAATRGARAHRPDAIGRSATLPAVVALPGTGAGRARLPGAGRRGRDRRRARAGDAGRPGGAPCTLGTRRLLTLTSPSPLRWVQSRLDEPRAARAGRRAARQPEGRARGLRDRRRLGRAHGRGRRPGVRRGRLPGAARPRRGLARRDDIDRGQARGGDPRRGARPCAGGSTRSPAPAFADARRDVAQQLGRLVFAGFATATGAAPPAGRRALPARRRAPPGAPARQRRRRPRPDARGPRARATPTGAGWTPCRAERRSPARSPRSRGCSRSCACSHFAQALGVRGGGSNKRIRQVLAESAR